MKYFYETQNGNRPYLFVANNDEDAVQKLKTKFGRQFCQVVLIMAEEAQNNMRTVWSE